MADNPECPLHFTWTCSGCGYTRRSLNRTRYLEIDVLICTRCGWAGTESGVHHQSAETRDSCRAEYASWQQREPVRLIPYNRDHIGSLHNMTYTIEDLILEHLRHYSDSLVRGTGTEEWNESVNEGNRALYEIEKRIREWVAEHPENPPPDTGTWPVQGVT